MFTRSMMTVTEGGAMGTSVVTDGEVMTEVRVTEEAVVTDGTAVTDAVVVMQKRTEV